MIQESNSHTNTIYKMANNNNNIIIIIIIMSRIL